MPSDCTTQYRPSGTSSDGITSETSAELVYPELSKAAKRRVNKVDVNQGHCAISNVRGGVDYAHILARNTKSEILDRFEYNMGMEWRTLNLDSRHNVILLEPSLRDSLLSVQWALLPELEIILELERILRVRDRAERRALYDSFLKKRKTYNYTFFPGMAMETFRIRKCTTSEVQESGGQESLAEYYEYPFADLPVIVSHVQPHFAILDAGMKMQDINGPFDYHTSLIHTHGRGMQVFHVSNLSRLWRADVPEDEWAFFFRTKPCCEPPDDDNSSVITTPLRLEPIPSNDSVPNHSTHWNWPAEDAYGAPLCFKSLRKFERISSDSRETRDNLRSVSEWAAGVTSCHPSTDVI